MLTAYQCEVAAGFTEDGEILCLACSTSEYTKPLTRYELDEQEVERGKWEVLNDDDHVENCACADSVTCEQCYAKLTEGYTDTGCMDKQRERVRNEDDEA